MSAMVVRVLPVPVADRLLDRADRAHLVVA
jgi:hypothetical protein